MHDTISRVNTVNDIKDVLKDAGFKKVKQNGCWKERDVWIIPSNIMNLDKALKIIETYDTKTCPSMKTNN